MRVKNSIRNFKYNIIAQILTTIISFVSRTIFVHILGQEYLGINGLFGNILTILSLADMGIATVLVYSMYEPLAKRNEEKMKQLINMYRKIYNIIALVVLIAGLCITPFLSYLIKDMPNIPHIGFIFILYLLNTVVSYLCIYKISIINADQKNYIVTYKQQIFLIISNISMVIVLLLTHNFILYLITQIFFSIFSNIYISKTAEKMYPFVKETKGYKLEKEEVKDLRKNVFAMMMHKIGGTVVSGTDNLIMSAMVGIEYVGIYSNYLLITNTIKKFISQIFSSIIASIGNLNIENNKEHLYNIFKKIFFVNFWVYSFCTICFIVLLNPFIKIWLNENYIFESSIVYVICACFFVDGMRQTVLIFRDATGLFYKDRYKPIVEGLLNLLISIVCTIKFGIIGIFIGTLASMVIACVGVEAFVLFKYRFEKNVLEYFKIYFKYLLIGVIALTTTMLLNSFIGQQGIFNFIMQCGICVIIPNIIFFLCTFKTQEFKYFWDLIFSKLKRRKA